MKLSRSAIVKSLRHQLLVSGAVPSATEDAIRSFVDTDAKTAAWDERLLVSLLRGISMRALTESLTARGINLRSNQLDTSADAVVRNVVMAACYDLEGGELAAQLSRFSSVIEE